MKTTKINKIIIHLEYKHYLFSFLVAVIKHLNKRVYFVSQF